MTPNPTSVPAPQEQRLTFHGVVGRRKLRLASEDGKWYVLIPLPMRKNQTFSEAVKQMFRKYAAAWLRERAQ